MIYLPKGQTIHDDSLSDPISVENLPISQSIHELSLPAFGVVEYLPATQLIHSEMSPLLAGDHLPVSHASFVPWSSQ